MLSPIKSLQVGDIDKKQPLLILPQAFVAQFATLVNKPEAEYTQLGPTLTGLTLVDASKQIGNRRFKLIYHHGSYQLSVPRPWLRELSAGPKDWIDIYQHPQNNLMLVLTIRRFHPNGVTI